MAERQLGLRYRVVGIRADGSRDARYSNLSWLTAEEVRIAMARSGFYDCVVIEDMAEFDVPHPPALLARAAARKAARPVVGRTA